MSLLTEAKNFGGQFWISKRIVIYLRAMSIQIPIAEPPPTPSLIGVFSGAVPACLLRQGSREAFRGLVFASAALSISILATYLVTIDWQGTIPRDATTLAVGRDFLNFWMYGRAAVGPDPGRFYDILSYHQALRDQLGMEMGGNWSYPPTVMLLAAPFGQLNYLTALACWTLLSLGVFVAATRNCVPDWRFLLPVLLSPAALICLASGQSSFLTAAMMFVIFAGLDRRPVLSGVLIGLLTIKPQLGILFPFMLIASGRWRVFIAAAVTTVTLLALSIAAFGHEVWIDFVTKGLPVQGLVLADPDRIATPGFPTIFMNLRGVDLGYAAAMSVQAVFSAVAIGAVVWAFRLRKCADPALLRALFLACAIVVSPYILTYDLLPLTFAAILLLADPDLDGPGRRLVQLVFWTPTLQLALGGLHVPGPALIAPAFMVYLLMRLRDAPASVRT